MDRRHPLGSLGAGSLLRRATQVVPGLSDRLLSRRLRELESEGLVERSVHAGTPARVSYALTDKGKALRPAIRELRAWAQRWNGTHS